MEAEEIIPYLAGSTFNPEKKDVLIAPVLKILDKKLDSYSDWSSWEYAEMLNPADNADSWIIDPRYLQRSANKKVHKTALRMFHKFPCSSVVLVPWFLIRQMEFDYICTAVEGLRLDSDVDKIKEYAGV